MTPQMGQATNLWPLFTTVLVQPRAGLSESSFFQTWPIRLVTAAALSPSVFCQTAQAQKLEVSDGVKYTGLDAGAAGRQDAAQPSGQRPRLESATGAMQNTSPEARDATMVLHLEERNSVKLTEANTESRLATANRRWSSPIFMPVRAAMEQSIWIEVLVYSQPGPAMPGTAQNIVRARLIIGREHQDGNHHAEQQRQ